MAYESSTRTYIVEEDELPFEGEILELELADLPPGTKTVIFDHNWDCAVKLNGPGKVDLIVDNNGDGYAIRVGGDGMVIRSGDGSGNAIGCENGNVYRVGNGKGDAEIRKPRGGRAFRTGEGAGAEKVQG